MLWVWRTVNYLEDIIEKMDLSLLLKSLEGDFQEEDEEGTDQVEGSACAKA